MCVAISSRRLLLLLACASSAVIAGALFGQYALGWYPCELCIYQRIPHILVIITGFGGALPAIPPPMRRYLISSCLFFLLIGAGIAAYHAGVEADIFQGPDACSGASGKGATIEELRAQIAEAARVSCKQAMAYIFGLSLAVWNMIFSLMLIIATLWLLKKQPA